MSSKRFNNINNNNNIIIIVVVAIVIIRWLRSIICRCSHNGQVLQKMGGLEFLWEYFW